MKLADKFNIPIISFIDTPGAYPGVGAEERGQAEAIARSIECSMELKVPTIAIIIGEGGSGGAIALASSNKVLMLENAIYSVISPEGCATILWRDPKKMLDAAKAMKLSARDLLELKVIDEIISEPLGGAHRDRDLILSNVREAILNNLNLFKEMSPEDILDQRKNKFLKIGRTKGFINNPEKLSSLDDKKNNMEQFLIKNKIKINSYVNFIEDKPYTLNEIISSLDINKTQNENYLFLKKKFLNILKKTPFIKNLLEKFLLDTYLTNDNLKEYGYSYKKNIFDLNLSDFADRSN